MKIYSSTSGEGTQYFWTRKEAQADAIRSAKDGHTSEVAINMVGRLTKELFLAAIRGGGWADEIRDLELWEPVGDSDEQGVYKVRCVKK